MKSLKKYYVVDSVAQTIVGAFDAVSLDMAKLMFRKGILENDKLKDSVDQYAVYCDGNSFDVYETFDEVLDRCIMFDSHDWSVVKK